MAYTNYSVRLKEVMVAKFLGGSDTRIGKFSRENGIPESSLRYWLRQSEMGILGSMDKPKHFSNFTLSEKFALVLEYERLSEEERGNWLRKKGLKSFKLEQWKKELSTSLDVLDDKSKKRLENTKIKQLEKELQKKDKALAEASAILFAKKKLEAYFGVEEEDE